MWCPAICYYYGSRGEDPRDTLPHPREDWGPSWWNILLYTHNFPLHRWGEDKDSPYTDEVEDKGNNAATDDEYLTGQNKEYLLILNYLIVCNTHWSTRH